jgi:hypothetical protein
MKNYQSVSDCYNGVEGSTNRIDKGTKVEHHRVEYHYAHGLERIAVNDIAWYHRIAHLQSDTD